MLDKTLKQPIETLQIFGILSTYMKKRNKNTTYLFVFSYSNNMANLEAFRWNISSTTYINFLSIKYLAIYGE